MNNIICTCTDGHFLRKSTNILFLKRDLTPNTTRWAWVAGAPLVSQVPSPLSASPCWTHTVKEQNTVQLFVLQSCQAGYWSAIGVNYLCLDLPEFCLFRAVHLTVDDQNIRETSNVSCLHLRGRREKKITTYFHIHTINMLMWLRWAWTHCGLILLTVFTPRLGALLQTDTFLQDLSKVVFLYRFLWRGK